MIKFENTEVIMQEVVVNKEHRKRSQRDIVRVDITAPLYWWGEFETYIVSVMADSTDVEMGMHSILQKILEKEFTLDDFSCEHLDEVSRELLEDVINHLNDMRIWFNELTDNDIAKKDKWWQLIQLLPSSYNQRRTVILDYQVLTSFYDLYKDHKLDEHREFCAWVDNLSNNEAISNDMSNIHSICNRVLITIKECLNLWKR